MMDVWTMQLPEVSAAIERVQAERGRYALEAIDAKYVAAEKAKEEAAMRAVLAPSPEATAALAAATAEIARAQEEAAFAQRHLANLDGWERQARARVRRLIEERDGNNLATAASTLKARLANVGEQLAPVLGAIALWAWCAGDEVGPEDVGRMLTKYGALDLNALFNDAQASANAIRAGEKTP